MRSGEGVKLLWSYLPLCHVTSAPISSLLTFFASSASATTLENAKGRRHDKPHTITPRSAF